MDKLNQDIRNSCTDKNCCINELVVLPLEGDVGFEEYFEHKAALIYEVKRLFTPKDYNKLMLAYPAPDSRISNVFERFFESPSIIAHNHEFEGLFAIDISDYIGIKENEFFGRLITYMQRNRNTVFLLFLYSNNRNEIQEMYDYLSEFAEFRKISIPLPDPKTLTDYTTELIQSFVPDFQKSCYEFLTSHYSGIRCSYDYADFLIRNLKSSDYSGNLESLQEIAEKVDNIWRAEGTGLNLGY